MQVWLQSLSTEDTQAFQSTMPLGCHTACMLHGPRASGPDNPHVLRLAPEGFYSRHNPTPKNRPIPSPIRNAAPPAEDARQGRPSSSLRCTRGLRVPVDPLTCSRCGSDMRILAVFTKPEELKKILQHIVKLGRSPPGLGIPS